MRPLLAAAAVAFVLVAAGPSSARYSQEPAAGSALRPAPSPGAAWGGRPLGRPAWMGYPYRQ